MKKAFILLFLFISFYTQLSAQNDATSLINEGIALHDAGNFSAAVKKYDEALALEPGNFLAMYEKSFSLMEMENYKEAEPLLKKILKGCKDDGIRMNTYVNYGNLLDYEKKQKKSIEMYREGLKEYPNSYQLYFNMGITENSRGEREFALENFLSAIKRNPLHASSHNAVARLLMNSNRIAAIMSFFTFLMIEPEGTRAQQNLRWLQQLFMKGISRGENGNTVIGINPDMLSPTQKNRSKFDEDFRSADLMLSLLGASVDGVADSLNLKTSADKMSYQMQMLVNVLDESKNNGPISSIYLPFLKELKDKGWMQAACYFIMKDAQQNEINDWLVKNQDNVVKMLEWFEGYRWNIN